MYNVVLIFFIIAHILGDFYCQWNKLVDQKNKYFKGLLLHCFIYTVCSLIAMIPVWNPVTIIYALYFAILHFIIDFVKFIIYKTAPGDFVQKNESKIYIADQLFHIASIVIICGLLAEQSQILVVNWIQELFKNIGINEMKFFNWVCILLLVAHPANITFKKIFSKFKPTEKTIEEKQINSGAMIGTMERIISVFLISFNQYAAIGLILTAKSIARYNKIAENKEFAEYYLLGTIFSILYSIISFIIIF